MDDLLGVTEAARILGVGPSSIKRWADQGLLRCEKTPGGHRRFFRDEIERLLRRERPPVADVVRAEPTRSAAVLNGAPAAGFGAELLELILSEGDAHAIDAVLLSARARYGSWWRVSDAVGPCLHELGRLWESGQIDVLREHLASERLSRALSRIAESLPSRDSAPTAMLVTAADDEHTLALSLAELTVREAGWTARWVGRTTPLADIIRYVDTRNVDLVAVSASVASRDARALAELATHLGEACARRAAMLVLGGEGPWPDPPPYGRRMHRFEELRDVLVR